MEFLREFTAFVMARKKFWLIPIFVMSLLFGGIIVLTHGTAVSPFIYALF